MWGLRAMQRVNAKAPWVTLASNMSVFAFEDLAPTVMSNVLDVVLLDPHWYGGIRRAKLAGQICEAMGVDAGMHSGAEFGISQAAMLHLAASLANLVLAPDSHYHHLTDDIIEGGRMQYKNGAMAGDRSRAWGDARSRQTGSLSRALETSGDGHMDGRSAYDRVR